MNWLSRLWRSAPRLSARHGRALDAWRKLPPLDSRQALQAARCVVVDVETGGLNPLKDSLISIGAVAVESGLIRFDQGFEVVLRQQAPSEHSNILVHGIGGTTQVSGKDPVDGLIDFLNFAGKAPLVAFHADFDRAAITRAVREVLGFDLASVWLDVAALAPALFGKQAPAAHSLDEWTEVFGIDNYARHDAVADALATAQLFQIILARAAQQGMESCADLVKLESGRRWLSLR